MHQNKNLQVSLLSAGRNTGRNCNQSAFHMDASRGDDSDRIILQISFMKHSPPRKAAVLKLVLVEVNILTYKSHLEWVSLGKNRGQKKVDLQRNYFHYFAFSFRSQQLPPAPFPHSPQLLMALFTYISLKLLSHHWSFRSIYLFCLLFWILMGFNLFSLFLWFYCNSFLSFLQQSSKCHGKPHTVLPICFPLPPSSSPRDPSALQCAWSLWKGLLYVKHYLSCWIRKQEKQHYPLPEPAL